MKTFLKVSVASVVFLFLLFAVTFFVSVNKKIVTPLELKVERGENLREILRRIGKEESLNNLDLWIIYYYLRLSGKTNIKAGLYMGIRGDRIVDFIKKIVAGKALLVKVTIPEGYNSYQIAKQLGKNGVCDEKNFLKFAFDPAVAERYGIPSDRVEGFLFPDTYKFSAETPPLKIIDAMIKDFWRHYPEDFKKREKKIGWDTYRVVILASIIQKEAFAADEMPLISAVYHNRLKKHMLLQADPTVIYGLFPHFDGNLRKKDLLDKANRWNTYIYRGLPPTPIGSPGVDAIRTALYPADVDYLYFVSMGNGRHFFSKTYSEHMKAVLKYQIKPAERRK